MYWKKSIDDIADMMDALLSGKLSSSLLSTELLSSVTNQEVTVAKVTGLRKHSVCYLRIEVPRIETWNLYRYRNIPFKGNGSTEVFYRLPGHNSLIASNKIGHILRYDDSVCNTDRGTVICDGQLVEIVSKPVTCVELLLAIDVDGTRGNLPATCITEMRLVVTNKQEYIATKEAVMIFSPFADFIKTRLENGTVKTLGTLEVGASRVTTDRTIFTDSLIIKRRVTYDSLTYLTDLTDYTEVTIASDILELSDKLGIVDRMNTTGLTNSLKNFIKAEGNLGMDIDKTEKQLQHIEH